MPTPEFTPLHPQLRKMRWISPALTYEQLHAKRVFARFITQAGHGYEGTGEIRALRNPEGRLAIDLAFMRMDSQYQFTDIVFHLSSRQATQLRKAPDGSDYQFIYEGHLTPDNEPDATQSV